MSNYDSNNDGLSLNHPRVVSYMSSSTQQTEAAEGGLRTFSAIISEKGRDNVLGLVTDVNQLISDYGNLNNKLYGQTMYNLQNWLGGNGEAYVLRVMPEDAGYAHAFLNVQTTKGTKTVKDVDGLEISDFPNVKLRPVVSSTEVNNINESLLNYELTKDRSQDKTIDGFVNHLVLAVYPIGRGKFYNNMGFRITLNQQMDNSYDFRVYNFEVVDFGKNDIVEIKEGPFLVSFDPNALSSSNDQSMFIEDVVNSYSKYLRVKVNTKEFENVCKLINPSIDNIYSLDPIFGITKTYAGEVETYLDARTKKLEDIHIAIQNYDVEGNAILDENGKKTINIVDFESPLERDILVNDNLYNTNKYNDILKTEEDMLQVLAIAKNPSSDGLKNLINPTFSTSGETGTINTEITKIGTNDGEITAAMTPIDEAHTGGTLNEGSFSTLDPLVSKQFASEKKVINEAKNVINYAKSVRESVNTDIPKALISLEEMNELIEQTNANRLVYLSKRQIINDLIVQTAVLNSELFNAKIVKLPKMLTEVRDVINFINKIQSSIEARGTSLLNSVTVSESAVLYSVADSKVLELTKEYDKILVNYKELLDEFNTQEMKDEYMSTLWTALTALLGKCKNVNRYVITKLEVKVASELKTKIDGLKTQLTTITDTAVSTFNSNVSSGEKLRALIKSNIKGNRSESETSKTLLCLSRLQNISNPVRLSEGSDGSLDENAPDRANTIKKLLIKAYSGLIDSKILDSRLTPFSFVLDGNNSIEVKNAIVQLCSNIRKDFVFIADCGLQPDPESTLAFRKNSFPVSSDLVAIYGQDFTVYDSFNGKDERFTTPYFLAKKITNQAASVGLQYPMAGNARGNIDGFKSINFVPNATYRELLYNNRINYVESDEKRTKLMSQLTSSYSKSPLSNLNNVITTLSIKREVENLVTDYQFEFEDDDTLRKMEYAINDSLNRYVTNKSCASAKAYVSASEYDKMRSQLKVRVELTFRGIIETVIITINGKM